MEGDGGAIEQTVEQAAESEWIDAAEGLLLGQGVEAVHQRIALEDGLAVELVIELLVAIRLAVEGAHQAKRIDQVVTGGCYAAHGGKESLQSVIGLQLRGEGKEAIACRQLAFQSLGCGGELAHVGVVEHRAHGLVEVGAAVGTVAINLQGAERVE